MALAKLAAWSAIASAAISCFAVAESDGFLGNHVRPSSISLKLRAEEFQAAANAVMGCGTSAADLSSIQSLLEPMWAVLPKNRHGNVEWRMMRYVAHRYFMRKSGLLIRGLEPARKVNDSHFGEAEILHERVPGFVEVLRSGVLQDGGFSLPDATALVATLEQLIHESEVHTLERVYKENNLRFDAEVPSNKLFDVAEEYMVNWMLGEDPNTIHRAMRSHHILSEIIPKWDDVRHYATGAVRALVTAQQRAPRPGHSRAGFVGLHSFADAHEVVAGITRSFASYWDAECQSIKTALSNLDKSKTGRVSLVQFYGANSDGEWRFGESEGYLRELGALEEGPLGSKHILIANYLQGASNCIVARENYLVCCMNECEGYLHQIEDAVGGPVAKPELILSLVQNMTDFDDDAPSIDKSLKTQLERIASIHGGSVPIHGRLFAQWLHYVFPYECAFPHKAGTVKTTSIDEYGSKSYAETEEIESHAALRNEEMAAAAAGQVELESAAEMQWMSQWSEEEELQADYDFEFRDPRRRKIAMLYLGALVFLILVSVGGSVVFSGPGKACGDSDKPRAHFV